MLFEHKASDANHNIPYQLVDVETKDTFAFFSECKWQDSGGEEEVMQMEGCNILWEDAENWGDAENRGEYRENMCSMSKLHKHIT